ncbi:MAG: hypothetical protein V4591_03050 [Bdellovibrionota bacterium]
MAVVLPRPRIYLDYTTRRNNSKTLKAVASNGSIVYERLHAEADELKKIANNTEIGTTANDLLKKVENLFTEQTTAEKVTSSAPQMKICSAQIRENFQHINGEDAKLAFVKKQIYICANELYRCLEKISLKVKEEAKKRVYTFRDATKKLNKETQKLYAQDTGQLRYSYSKYTRFLEAERAWKSALNSLDLKEQDFLPSLSQKDKEELEQEINTLNLSSSNMLINLQEVKNILKQKMTKLKNKISWDLLSESLLAQPEKMLLCFEIVENSLEWDALDCASSASQKGIYRANKEQSLSNKVVQNQGSPNVKAVHPEEKTAYEAVKAYFEVSALYNNFLSQYSESIPKKIHKVFENKMTLIKARIEFQAAAFELEEVLKQSYNEKHPTHLLAKIAKLKAKCNEAKSNLAAVLKKIKIAKVSASIDEINEKIDKKCRDFYTEFNEFSLNSVMEKLQKLDKPQLNNPPEEKKEEQKYIQKMIDALEKKLEQLLQEPGSKPLDDAQQKQLESIFERRVVDQLKKFSSDKHTEKLEALLNKINGSSSSLKYNILKKICEEKLQKLSQTNA